MTRHASKSATLFGERESCLEKIVICKKQTCKRKPTKSSRRREAPTASGRPASCTYARKHANTPTPTSTVLNLFLALRRVWRSFTMKLFSAPLCASRRVKRRITRVPLIILNTLRTPTSAAPLQGTKVQRFHLSHELRSRQRGQCLLVSPELLPHCRVPFFNDRGHRLRARA